MTLEEAIDNLSVLWERMTDSRDGNIFVGDISTDSLDTAIDALKEVKLLMDTDSETA